MLDQLNNQGRKNGRKHGALIQARQYHNFLDTSGCSARSKPGDPPCWCATSSFFSSSFTKRDAASKVPLHTLRDLDFRIDRVPECLADAVAQGLFENILGGGSRNCWNCNGLRFLLGDGGYGFDLYRGLRRNVIDVGSCAFAKGRLTGSISGVLTVHLATAGFRDVAATEGKAGDSGACMLWARLLHPKVQVAAMQTQALYFLMA